MGPGSGHRQAEARFGAGRVGFGHGHEQCVDQA
jgi:hypothetical protein